MTSPRSTIADAPKTRIGSWPDLLRVLIAAAISSVRWPTIRGEASVPPSASTRSRMALVRLSRIDGFVDGNRVSTSPARFGLN